MEYPDGFLERERKKRPGEQRREEGKEKNGKGEKLKMFSI